MCGIPHNLCQQRNIPQPEGDSDDDDDGDDDNDNMFVPLG